MPAMLRITDLVVKYDSIAAVKGISFEVRRGEVVSLLGSNGAGKTTTLRTILGLVKPSAGHIEFTGEDITELPPPTRVRRGLVLVPEGRMLVDDMTVRENLLAGAYIRRDRDGIRRDLAEVEERFPVLRERAEQKAGTLSGGERQMLAIGRALMSRPRLLLMDEPSLGLAPLVVEAMFETVASLKAAGMTILLVEQNAYQALQQSDRAYVMRVGKISLADSGARLLQDRALLDAYLGSTGVTVEHREVRR